MKLTELLQKAAIRSGIQNQDEALTNLITSLEGSDIEVPDTIASSINSLMNEDDAKVNAKVKNHFKREALDPLDRQMAEIAEELGLPAETIDALKKGDNTYAKPGLLKAAIAEKLKASGKPSDTPEAKKQIEELTTALQKAKEEGATQIQHLQSEFENERVNNAIQSTFSNYQWSEAYAPTLRPTVIDALLKQELAAAGAKIKRGENGIELVNANDEALPFRLNNEPVAFNQFADTLMAKHNLIKTAPAAGSTPPATSTTTAVPSGQATQSNHITRLVQQNQQLLESAKQ